MQPPVAVESMMQLGNVFRGDMSKRQGWGWHDLGSWGLFFKTIKNIGQVSSDIDPANVIKNDYVAAANTFDHNKVHADAGGYQIPAEYAAVDVESIRSRL